MVPEEILGFWYSHEMADHWFDSTPEIDRQIRERFEPVWEQAARGELTAWRESAEGCLALVIVLDQFPLNMFRSEAKGFSTEHLAIEVAKHAVRKGFDLQIPRERLPFLYMPLMHSEALSDQDLSLRLFEEAGLEESARFARHHREIVARFGRFPHRNAILGRESSVEELDYLESKGAFLG